MRQQPPAADAELGIAVARPATPSISLMPGQTPPESCQPPPEPPIHSPRIARASDEPALVLLQRAGRATRAWPVARMQTAISAASRLVETARREPLGMSLTLLTISSPRPGPDASRASRSREALARAFDARRDDARGDHRGLEQAEVILGEVEHLGEVR